MREQSNSLIASIDIVNKTFPDDPHHVRVLSDLRFNIYDHEFLGILGPSGCGKTTLLRLIAGLDKDYEGSITMNGQSVNVPGLDRGLMFQESRLLPWFKVLQNVVFALPRNISRREAHEKARMALDKVGLHDSIDSWPHQLSGGMLKRVALARAIVNLPKLLLLDEPLTALDEPAKYSLQDEIVHVRSNGNGMSILLVTHDVEEAVYLSDRILVLSQKPSHVLREIKVPLGYPRTRTSHEFRTICDNVSQAIFDYWWTSESNNLTKN